MAGYVSPMPVVLGHHSRKRYHQFPGPHGGVQLCTPESCREHYREAHWREGQTRGE